MASSHLGPQAAQPTSANSQPTPTPQPTAPSSGTPATSQAASPPSKQNLRSWWKTFSRGQPKNPEPGNSPPFSSAPPSREGFMDRQTSVTREVSSSLLGQAQYASSDDHEQQQSSGSRANQFGEGRIPPSGRPRTTLSNDAPEQSTAPPVRRRVAMAVLGVQRLKVFSRLKSKARKAKQKGIASEPGGIFGVPLRKSITYANVAISLVDDEGKSYIYGYVPIVVAKCGVYLKEKATNVEGIFRLSGAEKRIKELVVLFNSPDRYGKGLDWDGYTVHDAANVLRRYLNQLPEPIVPLDLYDRFREPLRGHAFEAVGDQEAPQVSGSNFDLDQTILKYQQLITELPPLNRQLLLYILDLLAVFASKSEENRMTSQNLAAIFQPGMLSHPSHDMAPAEYRLSQDVLVFLIENQDHFLIGMRGTAADDKTVQDVQNGGTQPLSTPTTPTPNRSKSNLGRSASNASAGADSLLRQGGVRRNVSVNSRHSKQSNGAASPASPGYGQSLAQGGNGGVHRSNTVPSKKSPSLPSNRLQKSLEGRSPTSPSLHPMATNSTSVPAAPVIIRSERSASPARSPSIDPSTVETGSLAPTSHGAVAGQSQDKLLPEVPDEAPEVTTPTRELRAFFQRSPTTESDKRQPNKLRKKRIPSSSNPSAQSSSNSLHGPSDNPLPGTHTNYPVQDAAEYSHLASIPSADSQTPMAVGSPAQEQTDPIHLATRPEEVHRSSDGTLKPQASSHSLHSREESMNEASDMDNTDDPVQAAEQKEKRRRWRLSRKKEENLGANLSSPKKSIGSNGGADTSTTSFHSNRGRKSSTGDAIAVGSDSGMQSAYLPTSNDSGPSHDSAGKDKEEKKGPIDWLKRKMHEAKEEKRERDAEKEKERIGKTGPGEHSGAMPVGEARAGRSMDIRRSAEKVEEAPSAPAA